MNIQSPPEPLQPQKARRLVLRNFQSPGDIVMLTAAVRDLHRSHPNQFETDVRTPCAHLWQANPLITPLNEEESGIEIIQCEYPLIHQSNTGPWHFIHGFHQFLSDRLQVPIAPTDFKGDVPLAPEEKGWISQVAEILHGDVPFWIVAAGGKRDYTIKWWDFHRFQKVVDHFRDRILFVQVGETGHHHPALSGVLDLRGQTDLRQLVRLVYHSQGILCPVTLLMHLAAAVETKPGMPKNRPCVVVAGGREPAQWEAYPHHQYIHTNGALRCCDNGGCWKARTVPLGDGDEKDNPQNLCVDVVEKELRTKRKPGAARAFSKYHLPRCMDMITAEEVARRVELYFTGGAIGYLTPQQARLAKHAIEHRKKTSKPQSDLPSKPPSDDEAPSGGPGVPCAKTQKPKPPSQNSKIFISIAAYRDPELLPTLRNCIEAAANPQDLRFCIAWQHSPDDPCDNLDDYKTDPRFQIIDIPYQESKGVCWARHEIQKRYAGEEYYLQLDSHHRFSENWDDTLKDYLHYLQATGHKKPLLSAYLPPYDPENDPLGREIDVYGQKSDRFLPQGVIFLTSHHVRDWKRMQAPFETRFLSAHFLFTSGSFPGEAPYDPDMYFHGEETSLAARAFTHGYDLFSPHRPVIWHEYIRKGKAKHWDDCADWGSRNDRSYARYRELFGMDAPHSAQQGKFAGGFGFGTERTLADYEKYAGIKFKTRQIHKETINGDLPPIKSDFHSGLTNTIKVCIDVSKDSLPEPDYDFFAVALLDKSGDDVFREDCAEGEIRSLFQSASDDRFIHIWRSCNHNEPPHATRVWPHSRSKGWMDRIEQVIPYE
jgi:ADP-heptose:LPS heptosyltransferase